MEPVAACRRAYMAGADSEIPEPLTSSAALGVILQQRRQRSHDRVAIDIAPVQLVHSRTVECAAKIQIVDTRAAADQADLRQIGSRAAIRTAGHADGYVVLRQPDAVQFVFQTRDQ